MTRAELEGFVLVQERLHKVGTGGQVGETANRIRGIAGIDEGLWPAARSSTLTPKDGTAFFFRRLPGIGVLDVETPLDRIRAALYIGPVAAASADFRLE